MNKKPPDGRLPKRGAIHTFTTANHPTSQTSITSFVSRTVIAPPVIASQVIAPPVIIIISESENESPPPPVFVSISDSDNEQTKGNTLKLHNIT